MSKAPRERDDRLEALRRAMLLLRDSVESLPAPQAPLAGNALLNLAVERMIDDIGCERAGAALRRLAALVESGAQPPSSAAVRLTGFDA